MRAVQHLTSSVGEHGSKHSAWRRGGKAQAAETLQPVLQRAAAARNSLVALREQAGLYKSILEISILAGSLLSHRKALVLARLQRRLIC